MRPDRRLLVNKYHYQPLVRKTLECGTRHYQWGEHAPVPSVTTILDKTADKSFLIEWRKRVGEDQAALISKESASIGTLLHNQLEKYILGQEIQFGSNLIQQLVGKMAEQMISNGISKIDEVWGCEAGVFAPDLYAGTTDCVGLYKGQPSIIDFKTSKKIKQRDWIEDYFLQGIFYSEAHNIMFDTNIKQVVILMVDREGECAEFIISGDEYDHYHKLAMIRLAQYYEISID